MRYQEWVCARQKLIETDTERCLGIEELGRFVWYTVADGELRLTKKVTADKEGDPHCRGL